LEVSEISRFFTKSHDFVKYNSRFLLLCGWQVCYDPTKIVHIAFKTSSNLRRGGLFWPPSYAPDVADQGLTNEKCSMTPQIKYILNYMTYATTFELQPVKVLAHVN
jgi:hypothetical protein